MASVIRIKRRRTDDPAEVLILSHNKKSRVTDPNDTISSIESVLKFAGTLASKDEPVSKHIKEAIRKRKIHKEMHPHFSEYKMTQTPERSRLRKQKAEISHNNRYRIKCSRRALDIDTLDRDKTVEKENDTNDTSSQNAIDKNSRLISPGSADDNKENSVKLSETIKKQDALQNSQVVSSDKKVPEKDKESKSPSDFCDADCGGARRDEKMFYLIDVEHEKGPESNSRPTASCITMNGVPMSQVKTKVPIAEESDDYVYDLYYTHTRLNDIQDEAMVTVEALCNDFLHSERDDEGEDFVYDDDDDSNDEDNWRNDYPDEDPCFFENAEGDYDYKNDMRESVFHGDKDDEGDVLSYWMDTRCTIDVDCNDFDDNDREASSSDEEAGADLGYY